MRGIDRNTSASCAEDDAFSGTCGGETFQRFPDGWVVGDDRARTEGDRFVKYVFGEIDGQENRAGQFLRVIADEQADLVPRLGQIQGSDGFDGGDEGLDVQWNLLKEWQG